MITNLNTEITGEDIRGLFQTMGEVLEATIHFNSDGTPKGAGEVVYKARGDAVAAIEEFDGREVDGQVIKVVMMGTTVVAAPRKAPISTSAFRPKPAPAAQPEPAAVRAAALPAVTVGGMYADGDFGADDGYRAQLGGSVDDVPVASPPRAAAYEEEEEEVAPQGPRVQIRGLRPHTAEDDDEGGSSDGPRV
jgi:hypothetical protein